eukprot:gnl/TRDRNA2_/TRDRNA2_164366_c0_seq2.p1 gnl/TRDRNA2_/TRDRNA2_164366_c0~~gnl/TRDRNA2_/TRDRNA2_164366_c0_seq2.p1  ORF type:complete len:425 (+),score=85.67 gnl/TRDRNA2_/TRDRNA2_164366_c0_seq2:156-1277(+)
MLAPGVFKLLERPDSPPTSSICVAGEALMDMLPAEGKDGSTAWRNAAGGSPFNVCIAATRLGSKTFFLSALSTDLFGEQLYKHLEKEGVDLAMARKVPNPSTLAFVSKTPSGDAQYAFFKENAADRQLTSNFVVEALEDHPPFAAVHVSLGAVTLEDKQMAKAFIYLLRKAQDDGAFTSFDPNIRIPMIDGDANSYRAKVEEFVGFVDLAKASDEDIAFMYGDMPMEEVAETWLKLGSRLVVFTRGADGLIAYYRTDGSETAASIAVSPPTDAPNTVDATGKPAPVADTVGAGDTAMGAILNGVVGSSMDASSVSLLPQIKNGAAWDDAAVTQLKSVLQRAVTAAAITCSRDGADPPRTGELQSAIEGVEKQS